MSIELMLESNEPSLLIIEKRDQSDIVVGVPHHAPAGVEQLPCVEHPDSDENAGFLGRNLAEALNCCSLVACNYPIDANKSFQSDYAVQIARWTPEVLVEIHGHGGSAKYDIEISSGGTDNDRFSNELADRLTGVFSDIEGLRHLSVCGEYRKIRFKAPSSVTITDSRWISYHIELPAELRKPATGSSGRPPEAGLRFCDVLAEVLIDIHRCEEEPKPEAGPEIADAEVGGELEQDQEGIVRELGKLGTGAIISEAALARMLGRHPVSVKRAVQRGELPPPIRLLGGPVWLAGAIVQHLEKRLEEAAKDREKFLRRIGRRSP